MNISVNGENRNVAQKISVRELLETLGLENSFVAVAVNQTCVPRASWQDHDLRECDKVEILAPMAGG